MVPRWCELQLSTTVRGLALPSWASFENTTVVPSIDLGGYAGVRHHSVWPIGCLRCARVCFYEEGTGGGELDGGEG